MDRLDLSTSLNLYDPVPMKIKLDNDHDVAIWRARLRKHLYKVRRKTCDVCGKRLLQTAFDGFEVHEGIARRGDVQGWKLPRKAWIFAELNCVLLCSGCHRPQPPTREWVWDVQHERYGDMVGDWYYGLPFKVFPRRFR